MSLNNDLIFQVRVRDYHTLYDYYMRLTVLLPRIGGFLQEHDIRIIDVEEISMYQTMAFNNPAYDMHVRLTKDRHAGFLLTEADMLALGGSLEPFEKPKRPCNQEYDL